MNQADAANNMHNHLRIEKELGLNSLFFDKVGLYLSLMAVVLIGIDTAANLLPGGADLQCFIPSNISATKEQTVFVNAYCDDQLPSTKFSGFTVFLQSFITTALYLLWDAYKNYYVHKYAENTQEKADAVSHLAAVVSKLAAPVAAPVSKLAKTASQLAESQLTNAVSQLTAAVPQLLNAPVAAPVSELAKTVSQLAESQLTNAVSQLTAAVPQLLNTPVAAPVSKLADAVSQLAAVPAAVFQPAVVSQASQPADGSQASQPADGSQASQPADGSQASQPAVVTPLARAVSELNVAVRTRTGVRAI